MLTLPQRLGTLDPINGIFASPNAYRAIKALHEAVKGVKAIELDEKIEGATVIVRLAAVSVQNGPEFTFNDCRIDKLKLARLESDALQCSYQVTAKPALNAHFGELVARFGHTAMIELRGESPNAQADLPLNSVGNGEHGTSSIGSPAQEREKAHARERDIAKRIEEAHVNGEGPGDDERKPPRRAGRPRSIPTGDAVN